MELNHIKNAMRYLLLLSILLLTNSCFSGKAVQNRGIDIDISIPPEFGDSNTFLICVLKDIKIYNKYLKKRTKKHYNGKYIFLTNDHLKSKKYSDKKVYRYIFDHSKRTFMTSNGGKYKRFFVYDRLQEKKYQLKNEFTFFANAIEVYMKRLEIKRLNSQTGNFSKK